MEPMLTINPLVTRNSTYDAWGKFTAGTIEAVVIKTSQFVLSIPRAQIVSMAVEDADGVLRNTLGLRPLRPTASDATAGYASWLIYVINAA
jgi:hypothetical protein